MPLDVRRPAAFAPPAGVVVALDQARARQRPPQDLLGIALGRTHRPVGPGEHQLRRALVDCLAQVCGERRRDGNHVRVPALGCLAVVRTPDVDYSRVAIDVRLLQPATYSPRVSPFGSSIRPLPSYVPDLER